MIAQPADGLDERDLLKTPALLYRLPVFEPTTRPARQFREVTNSYGLLRVDGRLGQGHLSVLEVLCLHGRNFSESNEGELQVEVQLNVLRRGLGGSNSARHPAKAVWRLLRDLQQSVVEISTDHGEFCGQPLYDVDVIRRNGAPVTLLVRFGQIWTRLFAPSVFRVHQPTSELVRLSGVGQAVARWVLTQSSPANGGWRLEHLFRSLGVAGRYSSRIGELKRDAELLNGMGIGFWRDAGGSQGAYRINLMKPYVSDPRVGDTRRWAQGLGGVGRRVWDGPVTTACH